MIFTKESGLVSVWLRLIKSGKKTIEDVPAISNLKEIIIEELKEV